MRLRPNTGQREHTECSNCLLEVHLTHTVHYATTEWCLCLCQGLSTPTDSTALARPVAMIVVASSEIVVASSEIMQRVAQGRSTSSSASWRRKRTSAARPTGRHPARP